MLGVLILALPEMYGVGYPVLERAVRGEYGVAFLVLLVGAKIVATSLTIAIGGSGGVLVPQSRGPCGSAWDVYRPTHCCSQISMATRRHPIRSRRRGRTLPRASACRRCRYIRCGIAMPVR